MILYFNSRSHEESDIINEAKNDTVKAISIHALTKRATFYVQFYSGVISIHALTKRATYCESFARFFIFDFNSRSHEESDKLHNAKINFQRYFNSRSHEESDLMRLFPVFR